jgi:type I restriction enzyme M protein
MSLSSFTWSVADLLRGDYKQSEYDIPFNRHFYVFKAPRSLEEINAELKGVTTNIMTMLEGLAE